MEYDSRHLMGAHEIGELLGVTRSRANQLSREVGFPKPYGVLHMGKVWKRTDIEAWKRKRDAKAAGAG